MTLEEQSFLGGAFSSLTDKDVVRTDRATSSSGERPSQCGEHEVQQGSFPALGFTPICRRGASPHPQVS